MSADFSSLSTARELVLASSSQSRARLLTNAGVKFRAIPAHVDETAAKEALKAEGADALQCAETLAELKAVKISHREPAALVIGADQMLECNGRWFDKPASRADAAAQLGALAGKTHTLPGAIVAAIGGQRIWHHRVSPKLTMRPLSADAIERYLDEVGDAVLSSVGAYHLEGRGVRLFSAVEGDFFAVQGLALIPLLAFLREHGIVPP